MNLLRQSWRRWGIRMLKVAAGLVALLLLGFLLIQGLLATPWLRAKVGSKISDRIGGLDVGIEGLRWTPWAGVVVRGLRVEQPEVLRELVHEPLLEVEEIRAWPDYVAAMDGEWTASLVTVESPSIHVTAEMLVSLAAAGLPEARPPVVVDHAVLAANDLALASDEQILNATPLPPIPGLVFEAVSPDEPETFEPMVGSVPADIHLDVSSLAANSDGAAEVSIEPKPKPSILPSVGSSLSDADEIGDEVEDEVSGPDEEAVEDSTPRAIRLRVKNGSFELIRIGRPVRLAALEGVDLDLPLFFEEEQTRNAIGLIEVVGETIEEDLAINLVSRDRSCTFLLPEEGSHLSGKVDLGFLRGLPIQTNLTFQFSSFGPVKLGESLSLDIDDVSGDLQTGGWLLAPSSLNGAVNVKAEGVSGDYSGQELSFDAASGGARLSAGLLQSSDFRLIGDEASILGNGWVTTRDGAAVVRVVVPFSLVDVLNRQMTELIPDGVFAFKPLDPGNRWFSDVSLWRGESGWMAEFGADGSEIPVERITSGE